MSDTGDMDRRSTPRTDNIRPVQLVLLGDQESRFEVMLQDLSEGGARIMSPVPIKAGSPVRLDVDDSILLGEAVYCAKGEAGCFVGLRFEQCLGRVSDLQRLVEALMGSQPSSVPVVR